MSLVLSRKEKTGVFNLTDEKDKEKQASFTYREIFPDKYNSIVKKHSSIYYSADMKKGKKKSEDKNKIFLDNQTVEAAFEILEYCVTDWTGIVDENGKPYKKDEMVGFRLYNILEQVDKLDEFMEVVTGVNKGDETKN